MGGMSSPLLYYFILFWFLTIFPIIVRNRKYLLSLNPMDPIDQSIQFWTKVQTIGTYAIPILFALTGLIFYLVTQGKIEKYQAEKVQLEKIEKEKSAKSGEIKGGKITMYGESPEVLITLILGNMGFGAFSRDLGADALNLEDAEIVRYHSNILPLPIKVKVVNKEVFVSMKITSADGKIMGEIVNNEWELNTNNYFRRNFDSTGFEVIDQEGIIKVSIDIRRGAVIYVHGVMYWNDAYVVMPSVRHQGKLPLEESTRRIKADKKEIAKISKTIPNLFKYPADKYFGVRNEIPEK